MDNFSDWLTVMVAAEAAVLMGIVAVIAFRGNRKKDDRLKSSLLKTIVAAKHHLKSLDVEAGVLLSAIRLNVHQTPSPDEARIYGLQCELFRLSDEVAYVGAWLNEATVDEVLFIAAEFKETQHKIDQLSAELLELLEKIHCAPLRRQSQAAHQSMLQAVC